MSLQNWNGARWWKCDLHTHTPASNDYGKGVNQAALSQRAPQEWLLDHMRAGIDCVAVTDHNSGAWIDRLRDALTALEHDQPDEYRPLHLFPGVEISVQGGVHLLAILASETSNTVRQATAGTSDLSGRALQVRRPPRSWRSCSPMAKSRSSWISLRTISTTT